MRGLARTALVALAALVLTAVGEAAQEPEAESPVTLTVRTSVKATGLISRLPDAPDLSSERATAQSMLRFRVEPAIRASNTTTFNLAYEQRLHHTSGAAGTTALGILPPAASAAFRVRPLVWHLTQSSSNPGWRHEVDRANLQVHTARAELTVGRQAIGWGRGVMFTAVDLFAPFSPLEVDREWRSGVDAVRADIKLTERSSLDLVGAFGDRLHRSAFAARARGYAGIIDVEVVGGRRAEDLFGGVTSSAPVGDAEVHGEAAVFRTPSGTGYQAVWKVVIGGSYRFPVGAGLLAYAEYHYSGFGAMRPEGIRGLVSTPSFVERLVRGDVQILTRHALGVAGSYEASPEFRYSGQWLHNPADRSGILAPALTYTFNDAISLLATVYVPYGRAPDGGQVRSEHGAAPVSGLLQWRLYF